jgi:predicted PurR-regulated permease PerM
MSSVVYGILGAAAAQGALATFGFWLAGIPGWLFLGLAVGALALIPLGLTALILFPAAGWLFYTGQTGWGIFMVIWAIVVGNIDSYIRPVVISKGADLPFIIVFLGIMGGIATGGILGLFIGATVLGLFYTLLMEWSVGEGDDAATIPIPQENDGE